MKVETPGAQDSESSVSHDSPDLDTETELAKYAAKLKLFGSEAQRINRAEFDQVVEEVLRISERYFKKIKPTEQLNDKETFGDVDMVTLIIERGTKARFTEIFKDQLKGYSQNSHVNSLLLKLAMGKTVHVDFIEADDEEDLDRKYMYYSKGHSSAMIGLLAKKLNFKYGTEGFFKRYKDTRGNWHDIAITPNLREGLAILGLSPESYDDCHNMNDLITWLGSSPMFDSKYYGLRELASRDRESVSKNQSQQYMVDHLFKLGKQALISDPDQFLRENYPAKYEGYLSLIHELENTIKVRKAIDGKLIMETFQIPAGKKIGEVMRFIKLHYPDAETITPDMKKEISQTILSVTP